MNEPTSNQVTRRGFVGACTCLAAISQDVFSDETTESASPQPALCAPLNEAEQSDAESSKLVHEILNVQGGSCAETTLLAVLHHVDLPDDRLYAAASFGGGMGQGDLCGLLTGGFMALGNAAGVCFSDRKKMKAAAGKMTREYWQWFSQHAPIHCRDLKPNYDRDGYRCMKQRVAMKLERLIAEHASPPESSSNVPEAG